eukprot:TRINITY_DN150_c0_g1_i3.p1 TRINITY_DN150_c0_g1~~TRINITY_DN150_c0_g1_i3.p1  ORF type:complete len:257 (-),score=39.54 TRINITY_DN150_c0_g1_i3:59-829(-)
MKVLVTDQQTFDKLLGKKSKVKFAVRNNKRAAVLTVFKDEESKEESEAPAKDEVLINWLLQCVQDNLMFMNLEKQQKQKVIAKMYLETVPNGTKLIEQGAVDADKFYVINKGFFDILVDNVKVVQFKKGNCFGELALMYEAPRAATVQCVGGDAEVWVVKRSAFRSAVRNGDQERTASQLKFLKTVPEFKSLLNRELLLLDQAFEKQIYQPESVLFNQGDKGDKFYVIRSGKEKWSKRTGSLEKSELDHTLERGPC